MPDHTTEDASAHEPGTPKGEEIKEKEGTENYVIGGEESYGLLIGSELRDKDAVSAVAILCEMAAYEKDKGKTEKK